MHKDTNADTNLLRVYEGHPSSYVSILGRLNRRAVPTTVVDEWCLAIDPMEEITDQNHVGGLLSTLKLAARVRLTDADRVLDLGCGIGGSARVLAEVYRCSVHGVDANRQRIQDATSLGALVRAPDGVTYQCADFLTLEVEPIYSVVWGQNSWIHCGDREQLAAVARSSLLASGRLAFEDVCVRDSSKSAIEARSFGQLCQLWYSEIVTFDQWAWAFRRADFAIKTIEDDGNGMLTYFENLMAVARAWPGLYPEREVEGWRLALELTRSGVLGYFRAVGVTAD